jgi:hypothetical protein
MPGVEDSLSLTLIMVVAKEEVDVLRTSFMAKRLRSKLKMWGTVKWLKVWLASCEGLSQNT